MKSRVFFFDYVGGKSKDLKHIQSFVNLDEIDTICEPFCGSCSFSTSQQNIKKFIINDIDKNLIIFLSDVMLGKLNKYIEYYNNNINKYINADKTKPTTEWYNMKRNIKNLNIHDWYLMKRSSRGGCGMFRLKYTNENITNYKKNIDFYTKNDIKISSHDYTKILNDVKNKKNVFVFLDPPYMDSFNASYSTYEGKSVDDDNKIIDKTKMFIDILLFLKIAKCKIMLIINKNAITEYLYKDFIKGEYNKRYDISGRVTKHLIICNYDI